ncbi:type 1 glutamine amidotransferase [Conexibacter arvalis]|uniref:GMP synthase-like glutamine amidotransferase n=1 Tax=Conexibacter arvalis TaxID=912552 RepID=A0A840IAC3_9ACTN|nr:type 1 glutamine amidotransferase [Conexibacter arvalis]MBB4661867.1 GMP synthase-like glutamine amidotransferase [Conexibacter arvalis]
MSERAAHGNDAAPAGRAAAVSERAAHGNGAAPVERDAPAPADRAAWNGAPALILQHGDWGPPGLLADWLRQRAIPFEIHRTWLGKPWPEVAGRAFVASLGSPHSPADADEEPEVARELELLRAAVDADTPVLGLCFGGQMLAAALGGGIEAAEAPELGWHVVDTTVPDEIPPGPWLQWHYHRFTVPPGAQLLASSPTGPQAFRHGRHLGVQFHPESTIEIVRDWAHTDQPRLDRLGLGDGDALLDAGSGYAAAAVDAAFQLFDAFWRNAHDDDAIRERPGDSDRRAPAWNAQGEARDVP